MNNNDMKQCCTFYVNGFLFGVDVLQVREIVEFQSSTPVPLTGRSIDGLINLRGEIVTSIDLREIFPLGQKERSQDAVHVVVMTDEDPISLLVDEVGDVIDIESNQIGPIPDTLEPSVKDLIAGVYKLESRLMLILDVDASVNVVEEV